MAEEQTTTKGGSQLTLVALLMVVFNILGCGILTLIAPVLSPVTRVGLFALMLLLGIGGTVIGFIAALNRPSRIVGLISIILCLTFGTLWGIALAGAITNPVDVNDTAE